MRSCLLRVNKTVCHISKARTPSLTSAIPHLSEIIGTIDHTISSVKFIPRKDEYWLPPGITLKYV